MISVDKSHLTPLMKMDLLYVDLLASLISCYEYLLNSHSVPGTVPGTYHY